ncbi:DUF2304 family protein [Paenibacillus endoradicis]|uniref:DUF2304 family protein n=1 Tax=Paenibacillus endoradicis TaxID=2972487 RepID=UPI0021592FDD|nr:DUF2304 family protein [Paenibacillus endoradicis]MCR8655832.1 DUF2304 family protein [Paenibacillus endoradicis]MCR8658158.1 DUF2304 family protein [Paenibacillus endoradicis]
MTNEQLIEEKGILLNRLDIIIQVLRDRSKNAMGMFFSTFLPSINRRLNDFAIECLELEKEINTTVLSVNNIYEFKHKITILEIKFNSTYTRLNFFPAFLSVYVGSFLVVLLISFFDVPGWINNFFGVSTSSKLISFGIAGALLYMATKLLTHIESNQLNNKQLASVLDVSIRLMLAIVVPIVLVVIFFKPDGTLGDFSVSPELLSFVCGYSAKIVIDIFNKLVEKVSKMIEAI